MELYANLSRFFPAGMFDEIGIPNRPISGVYVSHCFTIYAYCNRSLVCQYMSTFSMFLWYFVPWAIAKLGLVMCRKTCVELPHLFASAFQSHFSMPGFALKVLSNLSNESRDLKSQKIPLDVCFCIKTDRPWNCNLWQFPIERCLPFPTSLRCTLKIASKLRARARVCFALHLHSHVQK